MGIVRSIAALALAFVALACVAAATDDTSTQVSGTIDNSDPTDGFRHEVFTCFGEPTCVGVHTVSFQGKGCSNGMTASGDVTFTGLDLSRPGTFSGTQVLPGRIFHTKNPDGTCTYFPAPGTTWALTGTWTGTAGTLDISATHQDGSPRAEHGTFTAQLQSSHDPVFPMTVTANVTTTTASATAEFEPRAEDDGKDEKVFVFAHAPSSLLGKSAPGKRAGSDPAIAARTEGTPDICVLAQVDPSGHLAGVSAATMQPALSGVLTAAGQSVSILNNAPAASVAGATFYVGYGPDAATMIANGVYQTALSVPGANQCTATLAAAPAPLKPGALSGLWYNAAESGWGIHFAQRRDVVFAAWFSYDAAGAPTWLVAPDCAMAGGAQGSSGTCNGTLYAVSGPAFFGTAFNATLVNARAVGSLSVAFQDAANASMSYTVGSQSRTVAIVRQVFQTGSTPPATDYTDLWWNPGESGWGIGISQQFGVIFLAWFVYDANGNPAWYVAPDCVVAGSSCSGTLFRTTGPPFGPGFDPALVKPIEAGAIQVSFGDANNATLSFTVNGVTATKAITRQLF